MVNDARFVFAWVILINRYTAIEYPEYLPASIISPSFIGANTLTEQVIRSSMPIRRRGKTRQTDRSSDLRVVDSMRSLLNQKQALVTIKAFQIRDSQVKRADVSNRSDWIKLTRSATSALPHGFCLISGASDLYAPVSAVKALGGCRDFYDHS